jgi:hypothetical protein
VDLPRRDEVRDVHQSYQLVVCFNADRADPDATPAQTQRLELSANHDDDYPNAVRSVEQNLARISPTRRSNLPPAQPRPQALRAALARRLADLGASPLRGYLRAGKAPVRQAAVLACERKKDRTLVPDLIDRLGWPARR